MRDRPVANIIRAVKPLEPNDTIGHAAEVMRASGLGELPVLSDGSVVGVVSEAALLAAATSGDPKQFPDEPVSKVMSLRAVCANRLMSISQAAQLFSQYGLGLMPVLDESGTYLGVVTRADTVSALWLAMRPPAVAGMATPLGVYLTTGHVRAGAGDFGLFLAGVVLMLLNYLSVGLVSGAAWAVEKAFDFPLLYVLNLPDTHPADWVGLLRTVIVGASAPIFLILLRLVPLSGYHAAEHQVVHAIESGEPLTPARVRAMPRVHPRCGTNIVAAVILFLIVRRAFSEDVAILLAVLILVFAWRAVGGYFQYYITTKPPTAKQLESGIRAGSELLRRYREWPGYRVTGWRRIWNTGMPQVMLGVAAAGSLEEFISPVLPGWF